MVKDLVKPEDWLAKADLKDAYFLVPVHPQSPKIPSVSMAGESIPVSVSAFRPLVPSKN